MEIDISTAIYTIATILLFFCNVGNWLLHYRLNKESEKNDCEKRELIEAVEELKQKYGEIDGHKINSVTKTKSKLIMDNSKELLELINKYLFDSYDYPIEYYLGIPIKATNDSTNQDNVITLKICRENIDLKSFEGTIETTEYINSDPFISCFFKVSPIVNHNEYRSPPKT